MMSGGCIVDKYNVTKKTFVYNHNFQRLSGMPILGRVGQLKCVRLPACWSPRCVTYSK